MASTRDYRILCFSETVGPITHMSRSEGNEAIVAREPVLTARGVAWVPHLSGNALRHRLVREPGARWLIDAYGLREKLDLRKLNYLFHGGTLTDGGGRENTRRIADMQRLFPLTRLLGGCLPDQILAGSLLVGRGTLVCSEQAGTLAYLLGESHAGSLPARLLPAETFVSRYQYTRGDAAKTAADLIPVTDPGMAADSNLMIFAGQHVISGAAFVHDFTLPHVSEVELGCLAWSLRLWRAAGGTIGGQAARGHGRLDTSIVAEEGIDLDTAASAYVDYAHSVQGEAIAWLDDVFSAKAEKPAKPAKGAKSSSKGVASPSLLVENPDDAPAVAG